jgi:dihydrofolate reductase
VRKVVVYELLSLDGVAEDPDGFIADWDDAMDANLAAVIATQDAVILGRRSYTEWAQFWPSSQIQPFATFINGVTKYVATSTPLTEIGPMRRCSTAGWSHSFGISSSSVEAMSASTQVSR